MKTKINFKILIALGIMLLAVLVFNMNTVNASTEVEELYNKIPIEINVNSTAWEEAFNTIKNDYKLDTSKIIEKIDLTEGYDLRINLDSTCLNLGTAYIIHNGEVIGNGKAVAVNYKDVHVNATVWEEISNIIENEYDLDITKIKEEVNLPEGNTLHICFENANCLDQGIVWITNNNTSYGIGRTFINVHYKDEAQKTASNEKIATKLIEDMQTANFTYSYNGILNDENLTGAILKDTQEELIKSIKTKLNTSSNVELKVIQSYSGGDNIVTHYVGLFIDKVYYGSAVVMQKVVKEQEEINKSVSVTDDTTNIKLGADTTIVPENTVLEATEIKEQKTLNVVKESLKEVSSKFVTYDINLLSNGTKVQPNGKVKISIPVPTGFDTSKLVVYRVEDNGNKTEYKVTVEGNYATFETDHFSTYVLAEKKTTNQQQTTTNKGEKDNTPKTGKTNIIGYVGILTVISAVGIIAFRKKTK